MLAISKIRQNRVKVNPHVGSILPEAVKTPKTTAPINPTSVKDIGKGCMENGSLGIAVL